MSNKRETINTVKQLLADAGVEWEITQSRRHLKIYVGPFLAGILPHGGDKGGYGRAAQHNTLAQVRRAIARVKA